MKLKLDESLGRRGLEILAAAGHDVATVPQQGMQSATDGDLILASHEEGRALVTLDLDFANPLRFPPRSFSGIAGECQEGQQKQIWLRSSKGSSRGWDWNS